ncbi:hypothetical protein ADUPG1_013212, partial [Aduncisulcus paluster]
MFKKGLFINSRRLDFAPKSVPLTHPIPTSPIIDQKSKDKTKDVAKYQNLKLSANFPDFSHSIVSQRSSFVYSLPKAEITHLHPPKNVQLTCPYASGLLYLDESNTLFLCALSTSDSLQYAHYSKIDDEITSMCSYDDNCILFGKYTTIIDISHQSSSIGSKTPGKMINSYPIKVFFGRSEEIAHSEHAADDDFIDCVFCVDSNKKLYLYSIPSDQYYELDPLPILFDERIVTFCFCTSNPSSSSHSSSAIHSKLNLITIHTDDTTLVHTWD